MTSKTIMIFTTSGDTHACAADYVLHALGAKANLVNTATIPRGEHISVSYCDSGVAVSAGDFAGPVGQIDATWNRRTSRSFLLPDNTHPADRQYIRNSTHASLTGLLCLLDETFAVNPIASVRVFSNKLAQLKYAALAGFRVPRTLISNSLGDIESFLVDVRDACVKGYYSQGWQTDDGPVHALTARIGDINEFDKESYEISPHIYQEYINKKAEYRLTVFGNFASAIKINTDILKGNSAIDWRANPSYLSALEPCELPDRVIEAARQVLRSLGLRFGIFDIAETSDGDFVFFEVNEAGQWLWVELHLPDCRLLQPFCEYLISGDDRFTWDATRASTELSATDVCGHLDSDPRYTALLRADLPDQLDIVADERTRQPVESR